MASRTSLSFTKLTDGEWLAECNNCGASETDRPDFWGLTVGQWKACFRTGHRCSRD